MEIKGNEFLDPSIEKIYLQNGENSRYKIPHVNIKNTETGVTMPYYSPYVINDLICHDKTGKYKIVDGKK